MKLYHDRWLTCRECCWVPRWGAVQTAMEDADRRDLQLSIDTSYCEF